MSLGDEPLPSQQLESESDSDCDGQGQSHQPRSLLEKRQAQNDIFKAYVHTRAVEVTEEKLAEQLENTNDENLSIMNLLQRQENLARIENPRDYQMELFERAKRENTIAVLDTGTGKTLIAVLLLRHIIDEEIQRRADGYAPRIAFFLVDSVTLVFQQYMVLDSNLDHNVGRFCGAMGTDLWSKETWDKHFKENMVIVCTAEVLKQCLFHSFLRMAQINILIFDEAHHAKLNHPYAEIIRDYYVLETNQAKRPKIFGMTASPVDANVDIIAAAEELEELLHAKIATTKSGAIGKYINQAREVNIHYARLGGEVETPLYQEMKSRFGRIPALKKFFKNAKSVSKTLGPWASDMVWFILLQDEQAAKAQFKVDRLQNQAIKGSAINVSVNAIDADAALLQEAAEFISVYDFGIPKADAGHFSSKVLTLHEELSLHFARPTTTRCLVFVTERNHARLLNLIFGHIKTPYLKPGVLTGSGKKDVASMAMTLRHQILTLSRFRSGEINCLFATSIAEEGIDIPDCNVVIRFDLYSTAIQYIQSKGRARHKNSKFINMCEIGNGIHDQRVRDALRGANKLRQFCQAQPEDRLIKPQHCDDDMDSEDLSFIESRGPRYVNHNTGATLNFNTALVVLAHFTSTLPLNERGLQLQPQYNLATEPGGYICDVVLPGESPIHSALGQVYRRKALAKRSAAFEMCILLLKERLLDENLMPAYKKRLPRLRNAQLALNPRKSNSYIMRLKPSIWPKDHGSLPAQLFATLLDVENGVGRPHEPVLLLTRSVLPDVPSFPLYLNSGEITMVKATARKEGLDVTLEELEQLTSLTLAVFADVFSKTFERKPENMSYWLVPLDTTNLQQSRFENIRALVNWQAAEKVHALRNSEYRLKWSREMPDDELQDRFFIDPWDGGRRAFTLGVNKDLKALDPVPADCVVRKKHADNILEYSISLWKKSRSRSEWMKDQPVVEAQQVLHRKNLLAPAEKTENQMASRVVLCPQPMWISALPTKFIAMCLVLPAVIHRIEDYLIAMEATDILGCKLSPALALEAVTKDSDNTGEHAEEQINFRAGMGKNYERLEFLGDCFLKMATSIAVFVVKPKDDEFFYHCERMGMLCNKNLFHVAVNKLKLPEYIRTMAFSRRLWYPQGLTLLEGKGKGKDPNEVHRHQLGDKSIADVCEALIGAAFLQYNKEGVFEPENWKYAIRAVTKFVDNPTHSMMQWSDYATAYKIPDYQKATPTAVQRDLAARVEAVHPYHFNYPTLLACAFNHPSCPPTWSRGLPSYQRLEFLGDALLEIAVVSYLFYKYVDKDPQWLTEHKMAVVSNKFLGALCVQLGFHKHLRHNHAEITGQVTEFVEEIRDAKAKAKGAVDYWMLEKSPPKCLPDIVEAYLGAMFIDSNFNYQHIYDFFAKHILPFFQDMSVYDTFANNHPTTHLHNLLSVNLACRDYRLMAEEMPLGEIGVAPKIMAAVMIHDRIVASAITASSKTAKIAASKEALALLEGLAPFEFKEKYRCDCKPVDVEQAVQPEIGTAI